METMSLDELRAVKREMVQRGAEVCKGMHSLEVAGVLISMYPDAELEIEKQALSYALVVFLERSARSGS